MKIGDMLIFTRTKRSCLKYWARICLGAWFRCSSGRTSHALSVEHLLCARPVSEDLSSLPHGPTRNSLYR